MIHSDTTHGIGSAVVSTAHWVNPLQLQNRLRVDFDTFAMFVTAIHFEMLGVQTFAA
jgi:hypothetical protein